MHFPSRPWQRGRLVLSLLLLGVLGWWGFASLGHLLHHEDPLEHADLIFVLAGSRVDRVAEAGDLFLEGWAPRVLLSRQLSDGAELALARRGILIPSEVDFQREVLVKMGVPLSAIDHLDGEQVATATESEQLLQLAVARTWRAVIVVTSKFHTARARLAMGRRFDGTGTRIIMRASRYDASDLDRWWASRVDLRFVFFEAQKMLAYWIGVGD